MKRLHWWRHILVATVLLFATIYALPSAYPSAPTVDIRARTGAEVTDIAANTERILARAKLSSKRIIATAQQTTVLFADTESQLAAQNILQTELGPDVLVALNTRTATPSWLDDLGARAISLGLDLRGGVHFLIQVDLEFAITRFFENSTTAISDRLNDLNIAHTLEHQDRVIAISVNDPEQETAAVDAIAQTEPRLDLTVVDGVINAELGIFGQDQLATQAVGQNVETLRRRVDELGVAEPVIAQQGDDRIVVQLPGLQDTARAKGILGRRAALELRGVDERASASAIALSRAEETGIVPAGTEFLQYADGGGGIFIEKRIVLTGDNIIDANYGSDEAGRPAVHIALDGAGANKIKTYTRERVGEQLAIVLIDRDRTEVISAPRIDSELHARFLIHGGAMGVDEATEIALLLRSGSLATPIEIVEERTIGPSLGADNIRSGLGAVTGGFVLVAILIAAYYGVFGLVSVGALLANVLCLTALLAVLGAGLTLPGLAGFALTLGMAIDANVLINERIREELIAGKTPGLAIEAGFSRAFATILDANITTLIAGVALFALGSGPVRGFAVVLCLGIATSMFTAVVVARTLVDLVYGRSGRLKQISIG